MERNGPGPEEDKDKKKKKKSDGLSLGDWLFSRGQEQEDLTSDEGGDQLVDSSETSQGLGLKGLLDKLTGGEEDEVEADQPVVVREEDETGASDLIRDEQVYENADVVEEDDVARSDPDELELPPIELTSDQLFEIGSEATDESLDQHFVADGVDVKSEEITPTISEWLREFVSKTSNEVYDDAAESIQVRPVVSASEVSDMSSDLFSGANDEVLGGEPIQATESLKASVEQNNSSNNIDNADVVERKVEVADHQSGNSLATLGLYEAWRGQREQKRQAKRTAKLERELEKEKQELKKLRQNSLQQQEQLRSMRGIVEMTPADTPFSPERGTSPVPEIEVSERHTPPELPPPAEVFGAILDAKQPEAERSAYSHNIIFEKVAEAADSNQPIEKSLERRHEVKDADDIAIHAGTASYIPRPNPLGVPNNAKLSEAAVRSKPGGDPVTRVKREDGITSAYRQAAKSGFIGGLIIIALALIAYAWAHLV